MQRADPSQRTSAPAHGFWPRKIADGGVQRLGNNIDCGATGLFEYGKIDLRLFIVTNFQLIFGQPGCAQKAVQSGDWCIGARAFAFFARRA